MLEGWRRQQAARRLTGALIDGRERVIRRFGAFTGGLPWQWTRSRSRHGSRKADGRTRPSALPEAVALFWRMRVIRYGWVAE
jgi:hypothetical protein